MINISFSQSEIIDLNFTQGKSLEFVFNKSESADIGFIVSENMDVDFKSASVSFPLEFDAQYGEPKVEYYTGDYTVTPTANAQTLLTEHKFMADNVTVKSVPYSETSNDYGETVYIASEV